MVEKIINCIHQQKMLVNHKKLIIFSLLILSLTSCTKSIYKETFVISGTYLKVTSPYREAAKIVYQEFKRLDNIFNSYNPDSEISQLNRMYNAPVKVSPELIAVIKLAKDVYNLTDGYFDISKGRLYQFWKELIQKEKIDVSPSPSEIEKLNNLGGMDNVLIDEDNQTVTITKEGLKLDVFGIAKGFMVDKAVEKLKANGIDSAIIDAGGDLYCLGKTKNRYWRVGIRDPLKKGEIIHSLNLFNEAVATSGSYEQFFDYKGRRFSHLINPFTGYPQETNILSVSVVANNVTTADSLATAFFIMGIQGIKKFLSQHLTTLKIFVVTKDGEKERLYIFQ